MKKFKKYVSNMDSNIDSNIDSNYYVKYLEIIKNWKSYLFINQNNNY